MKALQNQDQDLEDTLHTLFSLSEKEQANPTFITEVNDNTGIKRFKFAPKYAKLLTWAMHLITNSLNNHWKATGTSKIFSFGWSYNYNMEFSKLVYRGWAMHLVLRSVRDRLLTWIQVAMEAVEECISGTGYPLNIPRLTITDQIRMQGFSPASEDLCWEFQLQQDWSAIFPSIVTATVRAPSLEQLERQKDRNHIGHLNLAKMEQRPESPKARQGS